MYSIAELKKDILKEEDKRIINNIPLAIKIANKLYSEENGYYDKEDLIQIAIIGLIKAVERYDPESGYQLSTYAHHSCRGEILRFMRDNNIVKLPRVMTDISSKVYKYMNQGYTDEQIKKEIGDEFDTYLLCKGLKQIGSLDVPIKDESHNSSTLHEIVSDGEIFEDKLCISMQLEDAFKILDDFEKDIIKLTYFENKAQTEIGKILDCSQIKVSRTLKKALIKLKKHLENSK